MLVNGILAFDSTSSSSSMTVDKILLTTHSFDDDTVADSLISPLLSSNRSSFHQSLYHFFVFVNASFASSDVIPYKVQMINK